MKVPEQTADIFKILSKGQFISSNSSNKAVSDLYNIIENEANTDNLREYFKQINFNLEQGDEYFYFSRNETKIDLENKIERVYKWIDIVDFLKTFDNAFGSGFRFDMSDIVNKIKLDAELESKLDQINKNKKTREEILKEIIDGLVKEGFIELESERIGQYKTLTAFKYIEQLLLAINISEEVQDEIPE